MKIYEIHLDGWHSYTGLFSSIEKACEVLPKCEAFKKALWYNLPNYYEDKDTNIHYSPNHEINSELECTFKHVGSNLEVYIKGFTIDCMQITVIPEIKKEGEPYSPSKINKIILDKKIINDCMANATIIEIELDRSS